MVEVDIWRHPVQAVMLIAGVVLVLKIKAPLILKLLALYVTIQTLFIGFNPNFTSPLIPLVSDYVRIGALHDFIMFVLYSSLILLSPKILDEKYIIPFYALVFIIDQGWLWISGNMNAGLMTAGSQSAGLLMCLVPFFSRNRFTWFLIPTAVLGMFYFRSSTAMICMATLLIAAAWFYKRLFGYVLAVWFPLIAFILFKSHLMRDSSRLGVWRNYLNFWDHSETYWFGLGFGSWDSFSRFIPFDDGKNGKFAYFIFHNDWLQILVEGGFIGLALSIATFIWMLRQLRSNRDAFASLLAYGAMMCFYSPLRFMIGQLFLVFLINISLNEWILTNKENEIGISRFTRSSGISS